MSFSVAVTSVKTSIREAITFALCPVNPTTLSDPDYRDRDIEADFSIEAILTLPAGAGISSQMKPSWPWEWSGQEATVPSLEHHGKPVGEPVYRVHVPGTEDLEHAYEIVQPDGSVDSFLVALRRTIVGPEKMGGTGLLRIYTKPHGSEPVGPVAQSE